MMAKQRSAGGNNVLNAGRWEFNRAAL